MNENIQLNDENPADGRSASNGELGFCPKKITILAILGALGLVPLLMGDMFRVFVANNLGLAMCLPFCYGGAIVLFWAIVDGNLNKEPNNRNEGLPKAVPLD